MPLSQTSQVRTWHDFEVFFPTMHRSRWQNAKENWLRQNADLWYCFWKEIEHYNVNTQRGQLVLFVKLRNHDDDI